MQKVIIIAFQFLNICNKFLKNTFLLKIRIGYKLKLNDLFVSFTNIHIFDKNF